MGNLRYGVLRVMSYVKLLDRFEGRKLIKKGVRRNGY